MGGAPVESRTSYDSLALNPPTTSSFLQAPVLLTQPRSGQSVEALEFLFRPVRVPVPTRQDRPIGYEDTDAHIAQRGVAHAGVAQNRPFEGFDKVFVARIGPKQARVSTADINPVDDGRRTPRSQ